MLPNKADCTTVTVLCRPPSALRVPTDGLDHQGTGVTGSFDGVPEKGPVEDLF